MAARRHRRLNWDDAERLVRILLKISAEVIKAIIELRGGR